MRAADLMSDAGVGGLCPDRAPLLQTLLSVLTVFSEVLLILMMRVPARPSRPKVISIPRVRKAVCARRRRPASARGFLGQPALVFERPSPARSALARRRSMAVPAHVLRSAMI